MSSSRQKLFIVAPSRDTGRPAEGGADHPVFLDASYSDALLQSLIDASASHIAILDGRRTIVKINRAWRRFFDETGLLDAECGIGQKYPEVCEGHVSAKDFKDSIKGLVRIAEERTSEFQKAMECKALVEPHWFFLHASGFRFPTPSRELGIMVSQETISATILASDALQNDEGFLSKFFATANIFSWAAKPEGRLFTRVEDRASRMLGYRPANWLEPGFWVSRVHVEDRERIVEEYSRQILEADRFQLEYRILASDGRIVWAHDIVNVVRERGKPVAAYGFIIEVAEQPASDDNTNSFGGRLIAAQEEERKRIARELHDDLNQRIALISIELEQVGQKLPATSDGIIERVDGIKKRVEEIGTDIRLMSHRLHPSKLDFLGLVPALRGFCKELAETCELTINFKDEGTPAKISKDVKLCIFRVAQEALRNAVKHSGATKIDVVLKKSSDGIALIVSDNGAGFDYRNEKQNKGLGFISMEERLNLVGGDLRIISDKSHGTRIEAKIPLVI